MRCLFCGKRLALLRKLTDGEFCSSAHRKRFLGEEQKLAMARLMEEGHRAGNLAHVPGSEEAQCGDPLAHSSAGFRTEEFSAKRGNLAPVVLPSGLEQPLRVCLVERTGRIVHSTNPLAAPGRAALPYEPGLEASGGLPSGIRGGLTQPISRDLEPWAAALSTSPAALRPGTCGLLEVATWGPKEAARISIRRPKTSVFLKLARPTPPALSGHGATRTIEASPLVSDTLTVVGNRRGNMAVVEPADFRPAPAGIESRAVELCATGIGTEVAPAAELVATGQLAPEVGLASLALAAEGMAICRTAPLHETFGAAPARPSRRAAWVEREPRPASARVDLSCPEQLLPDAPKQRHTAPESDAFQAHAAFPASPILPAALPACDLAGESARPTFLAPSPALPGAVPDALALSVAAAFPASSILPAALAACGSAGESACPTFLAPSPALPGAVPDALALSVATEMPSETVRFRTSEALCPMVAAVEVPDPTATPRWVSPAASPEPLPPQSPDLRWSLSPPDAAATAGLAGTVAFGWSPALLSQAKRRAESPTPLEPVLKALPARVRLEPVEWSPAGRVQTGLAGRSGPPWIAGPWMAASGFWAKAPADLKWLSLALPAVLLAALVSAIGWIPSRTAGPAQQAESARSSQVRSVVEASWVSLQRDIGSRAAINLQDDFRSGLAEWEGQGNWSTGWEYDPAGFVLTGPLALYRPSLELTDYRFEFLGQIHKKSLNWVFRAADYKNYYAMKIVLAKSGPLPRAAVVHYAVIDGKPERAVQTVLPMEVRGDTFFRVRMNVRGANFTVSVQDRLVDFWSDDRLAQGGVGFFSEKGERARLRWVEVSHQYDTLGRLCALLAPFQIQSADGSLSRQ